ncbi:hypothetical protein BKA70DRAFT_1341518 [Coprinopsis sp. MPI-PUGE-AT-0042]|nr:hypothetical protein BKA70DRAFT_1341518 [Coprinopsis sp. MPI-PUGE-AT-0042]
MPAFLRQVGSSLAHGISRMCGRQEHIFAEDSLPMDSLSMNSLSTDSLSTDSLSPLVPPSPERNRHRTRSLSLNTVISSNAINFANRDVCIENQNHFYFHLAHDRLSMENGILEHRKNLDARIADTGREFFQSRIVERWINREYPVLLGTGIPGAGKSILASALVEHVETQQPCFVGQRLIVAYVFLQPQDDLSLTQILAALIRQTLEKWPDLITSVDTQFASCRQQHARLTREEHIAALKRLWARIENVYLIMDGLHEVTEEVRRSLLKVVSPSVMNVSLFITSRSMDVPYRTLLPDVIHTYWIHATNEDVRSLVTLQLEHRCIDGKIFGMELERIVKIVWKASGGMFLHASLQMKAMELYQEKEEFKKALQNFPEKLESMYQLILDLMARQPPSAASRAKFALLSIIYAQRPLYFDELQYMLATSATTYQFNSETRSMKKPFSRRLVRLFHPSAEPVLRELLKGESVNSHQTLASICMASLATAGLPSWDNTQALSELLDSPIISSACTTTLLRYAYDNWAFHARCSSTQDTLKQFLLRCTSFPVKGDLLGPLHVAAYYNLLPIKDLPWEGERNTRTVVNNRTALMLAAAAGHAESVTFLLGPRKSTTLNATDRGKRTALMHAAQAGHSNVVELFLRFRNIKIDAVDEEGRTAMTTAQSAGHENIVALLSRAELRKSEYERRYGCSNHCRKPTVAANIPVTNHVS